MARMGLISHSLQLEITTWLNCLFKDKILCYNQFISHLQLQILCYLSIRRVSEDQDEQMHYK